MKKIKKGDRVKITGKNGDICHTFKTGTIATVDEIDKNDNSILCIDDNGKQQWVSETDFLLIKSESSHPLIIKKITRNRSGIKYHTWQFSKNKKVSNHQYDSPATRDKQLAQFIEDIKNNNYKIL